VADILGVAPRHLVSKSFYYCIKECCLRDAVQCLENTKTSDSIAYLRFCFRNPLSDDEHASGADRNEGENEGKVETNLHNRGNGHIVQDIFLHNTCREADLPDVARGNSRDISRSPARQCSSCLPIIGRDLAGMHHSSTANRRNPILASPSRRPVRHGKSHREIEAVISCSSDGLTAVLRHARPSIPQLVQQTGHPVYANGLIASPWATTSSLSPSKTGYLHSAVTTTKNSTADIPGGPGQEELMNAIRDAVALARAGVGADASRKRYR
jgi:hypothetical protein